jgi:CHAT domain
MSDARLAAVVGELIRHRQAEIDGAEALPVPYQRLAQRIYRTLSPRVAAAVDKAPEDHRDTLTLALARLEQRDPATRDLVRALAQGEQEAGDRLEAAATVRDLLPALTQAFAGASGMPPPAAALEEADPGAAGAPRPAQGSAGAPPARAPAGMFNQGSGIQVGGNLVSGSGNVVGSGNTIGSGNLSISGSGNTIGGPLSPPSPVAPTPQAAAAPAPAPVAASAASVITILFVGANPLDGVRLRLDEEVREIDTALRQGALRDRFDLKQHWAVRMLDLQQALLLHRPRVLHFSGHGSSARAIYLEGEAAQSQAVSGALLARLLALFNRHLRCVVLNACYSEAQARAIAEHVECVVGMTTAVGDRAAICFAAAFYQALAYGADVQTAFELGCVQVEPASPGEENTPKLIALRRKPSEILLSTS